MASAYAALVSLMNTITIETTPGRHPSHQVSIDTGLIEALHERVNFLVEFLEEGWKGTENLEGRIADVAHAAEDAIELYVVDTFLARRNSPGGENTTKGSEEFRQNIIDSQTSSVTGNTLVGTFQDLEQIVQEMDMIKSEAIKIKEMSELKELHPGRSSCSGSSNVQPSEKSKVVGFADERIQIMEELIGRNSSRTIIPIVGMGGAGKTTVARNIYNDELIVQHFDVRVWITVSQEYNVKEILRGVLLALKIEVTDENFGDQVYKTLLWRRYLIVLDDIWRIDAWDEIQRFFPENSNGSRIMVTTRLSNLAKQLSSCSVIMKYLDDDNSWNLLRESVFGQNSCPLELEGVGKKIAQNCKGLPLAIVIVGGLLAKFNKTIEYWKHVAELSSPAVYLDDDENCSKILSLSYNHLSIHLKPCFLYMGIFPEDHEIHVTELINLWVAEGLLKPLRGKNMEEIAEKYLMDLIEMNLVTIHELSSRGKIKSCTMHDLLREFCLSEAHKEKFLHVVTTCSQGVTLSMQHERCIILRINTQEREVRSQIMDSLLSTSHVRSLIVNYDEELLSWVMESPIFRLLRVLLVTNQESYNCHVVHGYPSKILFNVVNLRYLPYILTHKFDELLNWNIGFLRNLQTLLVKIIYDHLPAASEIWNLHQLRHVECGSHHLANVLWVEQEQHDNVVLQQLRTLKGFEKFRFDEGFLKKIPNIKKMKLHYGSFKRSPDNFYYIGRLKKLESFSCSFHALGPDRNVLLHNLALSLSLKKLTLCGSRLLWKDMTIIGSLPHLELLKLSERSVRGPEWNPIVGEFLHLKFLYMSQGLDLESWNVDSTHFPRLEQLYLLQIPKLKEIPLDVGEIPTLRLIVLEGCSRSVVNSAKRILQEQRSLGNNGLVIKVSIIKEDNKGPLGKFLVKTMQCIDYEGPTEPPLDDSSS